MDFSHLEQALIGMVLSAASAAGGLWAGGRNKVSVKSCRGLREDCQDGVCGTQRRTDDNVSALMSFARFQLQDKGLRLEQINEILTPATNREGKP